MNEREQLRAARFSLRDELVLGTDRVERQIEGFVVGTNAIEVLQTHHERNVRRETRLPTRPPARFTAGRGTRDGIRGRGRCGAGAVGLVIVHTHTPSPPSDNPTRPRNGIGVGIENGEADVDQRQRTRPRRRATARVTTGSGTRDGGRGGGADELVIVHTHTPSPPTDKTIGRPSRMDDAPGPGRHDPEIAKRRTWPPVAGRAVASGAGAGPAAPTSS
ncbi:hypothetical protein HNR16_000015 [Pseudoclavibacter chungangensis]|uniref:hypothetical protein n=1 Tax=Pseudoclavibacter chungangensis TaxID=587635 RepID=UPI00181C8100|nr:hypothetical protein [Pseudoclavibacter chungangensis]NYJ65227.1 hypothetical protein [Pseudoclavibacter chungangensis]